MHFTVEQHIDAPLEAVEAAFVDPAFLDQLGELPTLGSPELLDQHVDGHLVVQRVRYQFAGELSSAVTRAIDPAKLTWIDASTLDRDTHRTSHQIIPDHYASRLECAYETILRVADGGTDRTASGDLRVRFPLVGGRVERAIVSGLREHAVLEAQALTAWLAKQG